MSALPLSRTTALLLGAAAVAWVVTVERMSGMDDGPGTDLGDLGWYVGIWVTMAAAMMLPSALPAAQPIDRLTSALRFAAGYLGVWTVYGLAAFGVFRVVTSFDTGWLAWDENGPYVAGGVVVAASLYELTALKRRSLHRCRHPRDRADSLRSGLAHGVDCVACSGGLMLALFALGVMSLVWTVVVAAAIFAEKVLPHGPRISRFVTVGLLALGIWVAAAPGSVPGLTEPDRSPSMPMQGRSME
jgi:predicted metal-binding membrane protein